MSLCRRCDCHFFSDYIIFANISLFLWSSVVALLVSGMAAVLSNRSFNQSPLWLFLYYWWLFCFQQDLAKPLIDTVSYCFTCLFLGHVPQVRTLWIIWVGFYMPDAFPIAQLILSKHIRNWNLVKPVNWMYCKRLVFKVVINVAGLSN